MVHGNDKESLPALAAIAALVSVQTGAAIAKTLFPVIGPEGVAALRMGLTALLLGAAMRPWRTWQSVSHWKTLVGYGVMLGLMNLLIYRAFEYIPVSIAVSIEVIGPLGVALVSSRRPVDLVWIGMSSLGLVLLPFGALKGGLDLRGVGLSLLAALTWGLYVVFGARVASGGGKTVATGMMIASIFIVPLGFNHAGSALLQPSILGIGLGVALLSSALPFLLDVYAMRHLPTRTFGVLLSVSPAVSAIAGWVVLHEVLSLTQCLGIACIVGACAGSTYFATRPLA